MKMVININPSDRTAVELLILGIFLICFGLISKPIKHNLYLTEPLLATILGVIIGPKCLNFFILFENNQDHHQDWFEDARSREILGWIVRLIIGVQVLFVGSHSPSRYLGKRQNLISMTVLMLPVMFSGLAISSGIIKLIIPGLSIAEAFMLGGALTPTDPVLANSVVKGSFAERFVPVRIQELLMAESGLNDGFGTPFLYLPLCLIIHDYDLNSSFKDFFLRILLWNVILGSILGFLIGLTFSKLLIFSRSRNLINFESMIIFAISISFLTLGLARVLGTNELLACFFAGNALSWLGGVNAEHFHSDFSDGIEMLFDTGIFIILGTLMPWDSWKHGDLLSPWRLVLIGILILIFRRLPAILCLYRIIPGILNVKEATFFGHFGPIGVGAVYYALVATEEIEEGEKNRWAIIPIIFFVILCSVIVHGISTPMIMLIRTLKLSRRDKLNHSISEHGSNSIDHAHLDIPHESHDHTDALNSPKLLNRSLS